MPLTLAELLSHLSEPERGPFLRMPEDNQRQLRSFILESARLPRSAEDLICAPGTVSGPALERSRKCERGRIELLPGSLDEEILGPRVGLSR